MADQPNDSSGSVRIAATGDAYPAHVLVLTGIAFLAGVITALSPCVLPVLPLVLAASAASESRWRPFAIVAGLVVSFTTFTLAGATLLSALGLPQDTLRKLAIAMLFGMGWTLGKHIGRSGWGAGLAMVCLGLVLVAITIALGG